MCDCEKSKIEKEFEKAFDIFMDEWRQKEGMDSSIIITELISEVRIEACFFHDCFYHMSGMLGHILNYDLKRQFDDIIKFKKDKISCSQEGE